MSCVCMQASKQPTAAAPAYKARTGEMRHASSCAARAAPRRARPLPLPPPSPSSMPSKPPPPPPLPTPTPL